MNKQQLIRFLENKRSEALNNLEERYVKAEAEYWENFYQENRLDETVDKAFPLIEELENILEEFRGRLLEKGAYSDWRCNLDNPIRICANGKSATRKDLSRMVNKDIPFIEKQKCEMYNARKGINENYDKLIIYVKAMPTAKEAAGMLTEMGFDLSELERPIEKKQLPMSRPDINRSFLFVPTVERQQE